MSEHSKGPWMFVKGETNSDASEHGAWGSICSEDGLVLADVWADIELVAQSAEANARLMALAPMMLEQIKKAVAFLDKGPDMRPDAFMRGIWDTRELLRIMVRAAEDK